MTNSHLTGRAHGGLGLVSEQSIYNLTNRAIEQELIPALEHFGIGLIPWSPLAMGVLAGRPGAGEDTVRRSEQGAEYDRLAGQLTEYEALCADLGHSPAAVAQAWLLHQPAVSTLIAGARTVGQLEAAVAALDIELDDATLIELNRIWPGLGTAPQSYAW